MKTLTLGAAALALAAGCASLQAANASESPFAGDLGQPGAVASFVSPEGEAMGSAELYESALGVLIRVNVTGLDKGWYSFHIHEKGSCADGHMAAGGHLNPSGAQHGYLAPGGAHAGDLPNIHSHYRIARAEFFTEMVSLTGAYGRPNLLDEDGSTFMIHEGPDDHASQPTGGGGGRIACAVIERP